MKGIHKCDDREALRALFFSGIFAGDLDGALISLRTGIAEKDFFHSGPFTEHFCQHRTGLGVV